MSKIKFMVSKSRSMVLAVSLLVAGVGGLSCPQEVFSTYSDIETTKRIVVGAGRSPKIHFFHNFPTPLGRNDVTIDRLALVGPNIVGEWHDFQTLASTNIIKDDIPFDEFYIAHVGSYFPLYPPAFMRYDSFEQQMRIFKATALCLDVNYRGFLQDRCKNELQQLHILIQLFTKISDQKLKFASDADFKAIASALIQSTYPYFKWINSCLKSNGIFRYQSENMLPPDVYPILPSSSGFNCKKQYTKSEYLGYIIRFTHGFIPSDKLLKPREDQNRYFVHNDLIEPAIHLLEMNAIQCVYKVILETYGFKVKQIGIVDDIRERLGAKQKEATFQIIAHKLYADSM